MAQRTVLLNVGGGLFVLNKPSDIIQVTGVLGTILDPTVEIPWDVDELNPWIFFDRDPTFFQYILNYFHNGSVPKDEPMSPADMNLII